MTDEGSSRAPYEVVDQLARSGRHVHLIAEGQSICYSGQCPYDSLRIVRRPAGASPLLR